MERLRSHIQLRIRAVLAAHSFDLSVAALPLLLFRFLPLVFLVSFVHTCLARDPSSNDLKTDEQFAKYRSEAWTHFQMRCREVAGERIYRKVTDVPGLLLLRPRAQATDAQLRDQYWRGDPYGHDSILPDSEIRNFIGYLNDRGLATTLRTPKPGYSYVETKELHSTYRRYQLDPAQSKIVHATIEKPKSRYGMTWEDISTGDDRKYWVAGGKLSVIDLRTNEVLAERIGFLIEPGFGSRAGGRVPWGHARFTSSDRAACPPFRARTLEPINRLLVERVLTPKNTDAD